jgi:3-hydroxyisobutyrate dehydrogenase-like beta-hydroxyacid dehydrogenase
MVDFSVGVVGLDALGAALTRRLDEVGIGHTPTDLNTRMLQAHLAGGGSAPAGSPYDVAQMCDLILIAETTDETLREAVLGSVGLAHALRPGTILVDMSDASPQTGPALSRAVYSKGVIWIEATPIGSPDDARNGRLTLLTSGPAAAVERVTPVLQAFAAKTLRLGDLGSGPLVKAVLATLGALSAAVHTEMLALAKASGLDPAGLLAALPLLAPETGAAPALLATEVMSGRYQSGRSSRRLLADIGQVLDAARAAAAPVPFTSLLQAAVAAASHAPWASGDQLDAARWIAENAGVAFGDTMRET